MKIMISAIALVVTLSCGAAFAGDSHPAAAGTTPADAMGHGKMHMDNMTPADHQRMVDEKFSSIDANKDGSLSKEEFAKHHEMMRAKHQEMKQKAGEKAKEQEGHDHAATHKGNAD